MKDRKKNNSALFICLLLAVVWIVLVLLLTKFTRLGFTGWLGFLYIPVSIALVYYCISVQNIIKNDSGTLGIPIYYSAIFLVIGIILNGSYLLLGSERLRAILLALDIVLLAVYVILMLAAGKHIDNVNARIEKSEKNTATASFLSRELGNALVLTNDKELHQELLHLKETIDYTGNSGKRSDDEVILSKVNELKNALSDGTDRETVLGLINQLDRLWTVRNN